jgi:redox-sensitive bicupin YhaK (pirin superfamily)
MLVPERTRNIGAFTVGRLLPFRKKRQVGPFTFVDHMGPIETHPPYHDVDQHPHIGLCTLTYLFEGSMAHTDSTGAKQVIRAGDVGFMTSGKGVSHAERTPEEERLLPSRKMHGYQIWIALPREKEEMEARFDFLSKKDIPTWSVGEIRYKLLAGSGFGRTSPLHVHSELFLLELENANTTTFSPAEQLAGELGIIVVKGQVVVGDEIIEAGNMLITDSAKTCSVEMQPQSHLLVLGGQAYPEERHLLWNFVSSSKERLEQAKQDWINKKFPKIPGDDSYLPFPGTET